MYLWPRAWVAAALRERERRAEATVVRLGDWIKRRLASLFGG